MRMMEAAFGRLYHCFHLGLDAFTSYDRYDYTKDEKFSLGL